MQLEELPTLGHLHGGYDTGVIYIGDICNWGHLHWGYMQLGSFTLGIYATGVIYIGVVVAPISNPIRLAWGRLDRLDDCRMACSLLGTSATAYLPKQRTGSDPKGPLPPMCGASRVRTEPSQSGSSRTSEMRVFGPSCHPPQTPSKKVLGALGHTTGCFGNLNNNSTHFHTWIVWK